MLIKNMLKNVSINHETADHGARPQPIQPSRRKEENS